MRVLLDTQIFLILTQQGIEDVSSRVRKVVQDEDSELLISAVSITEMAVKASISKLAITAPDLSKAAEDLRLTLIPFEARHAIRMFDLPLHHRNPFDRMLVATALSAGVPMITSDEQLKRYRGLKVIS